MLTTVAIYFVCASAISLVSAQEVIVQTNSGTVRGRKQVLQQKTVDTFLGIPFAEPPIGQLRFKKPVEVKPWSGVKDALKLPYSCHQGIDTSFGRRPGVDMWNPNTEMKEDCLYLNVWSPSTTTTKKKAVLVWIFGGGFWGGTSTLDVYNGQVLASETDVVVVSMNYRVGPLGFLYLGDDSAPGNMGLLDQQVSLKWIYDNIDSFGGDKTRITLFGESAGAVSVSLHLLAPKSRNLFTRASLLSGSAHSYWAVQNHTKAMNRANQLAKHLKCKTEPSDAKATAACLRELDASVITAEQWNVSDPYYFDPPFSAVIDGHFLVEKPEETIRKNEMKKCEIMGGVVSDEGNFWLIYGLATDFPLTLTAPLSRKEFATAVDSIVKPYLPRPDTLVQEAIIFQYEQSIVKDALNMTYRNILDDLSGDLLFVCPAFDFAHEYAASGQDVYMYQFNQRTVNNDWPQWMGVLHGYEIEFIFGYPLNDSRGYTSEEKQLSIEMMKYWSNFAKTGDPNRMGARHDSQLPTWSRYTTEKREYTILEKPNRPNAYGYRHNYCSFWRELVPKLLSRDNRRDWGTTACVNGVASHRLQWVIIFVMVSVSHVVL